MTDLEPAGGTIMNELRQQKYADSRRRWILFAALVTIPFCVLVAQEPKNGLELAKQRHAKMGRGISLANFLEITNPSNRVRITTDDIVTIKNAGFNTIRVPVKWEYDRSNVEKLGPYDRGVYPDRFSAIAAPLQKDSSVAGKFLKDCNNYMGRQSKKPVKPNAKFTRFQQPEEQLACVILRAKGEGIMVIVTNHHNNTIIEVGKEDSEWSARKEAFLNQTNLIISALEPWNDTVMFELLNEPNADKWSRTNMDRESWEIILSGFSDENRKPTRLTLLIGGTDWNSIRGLDELNLPMNPNGGNIILTAHYYDPPCFAQAYEKRRNSRCLNEIKAHRTIRPLEGGKCSLCCQSVECSNINQTEVESVWWSPHAKFPGSQHPSYIPGKPLEGEVEKKGCDVIRADFKRLREIAKEKGYPVFLGEFGTTTTIADSPSRVQWAYHIVRAARVDRTCQLDMDQVADAGAVSPIPWVYWGYNSEDFGIFRIPEDSQRANCLTPEGRIIKKKGQNSECSGQDILRALMSADKMSFAEIIDGK
ncbi:MAG: cellulase family glycosylhydrolase [Leptospiraceae bacterium]